MSAKHDIVSKTLSAAVGAGGTFTIDYPLGKSGDDYRGGSDHQIHGPVYLSALSGDFTLTYGASNITVTMASGRALAQGSALYVHLDRSSLDHGERDAELTDAITPLRVVRVALGKPIAAAANSVVLSQAATAAAGLATGINGARAAAGVATMDQPRNIVAAWTGAAVLTVTGTDEFGAVVRESSASGTSFTGKKAFKTITGISVSADVTALTVGHGDVLGLPVFVASATELLKEIQDDAAAVAGTLVLGDTAVATATTGDVRGTYDPNAACDGAKSFELILAVRSAHYRGATQY